MPTNTHHEPESSPTELSDELRALEVHEAGRKMTFAANNVGQVPHELMIERMPMKFDSPMQPNEAAAQGMIKDMDPGRSGRMTLRLRPGTYVLFGNVAGHYVAGQHITFTVTP